MINYKFYINLVIVLLFCTCVNDTEAQSQFEILDQKHRTEFKKNITAALKTSDETENLNEKEINITAVSSYSFMYETQYPLTNLNSVQFLKSNRFDDYAILKKNNKVIGYGKVSSNLSGKDIYVTNLFEDDELESPAYMKRTRIIETAEKFSSNFFLIAFQQNLEPQPELIGIIQEGRLKIMDVNGKLKTLVEYICDRYGSMKKFDEITKARELESTLFPNWIKTIDSSKREEACINCLRNYYKNYAKRHPEDTVKVLELFFKEIEQRVVLEDCQKKALTEKLTTQLSSRFSSSEQTEFYGYDVSDIISSILTNDQIGVYQYNKEIYSKFYGDVKNFLFDIYLLRRYNGAEILVPSVDDINAINKMIDDVILRK